MDGNHKFVEINSSFEKRDLEDFEFLEQLANDDASFLSSLSTVEKVLEKHNFTKFDLDDKNSEFENSKEANLKNMTVDTNLSSKTLKEDDFSPENSDCESWSNQKSNEESDNSFNKDHISKINDSDEQNNENNDELSTNNGINEALNINNNESFDHSEKLSHSNKLKSDISENSSKSQTEEFLSNLAQKLFPGITENGNEESISSHNSKKYPSKVLRTKNQSNIPKSSVNINKPLSNNTTTSYKENKKSSDKIDDNLRSNIDKDILMRTKLNELDEETKKFKNDNKILDQLKAENEGYLKLLKKELAEFEMKKKLDKDDFEKYKTKEIQKLKKDRKIFENYKLGQEKNFNRESRSEIDALKSELEDLKRTLKEKEKKHQMAMERMKNRVGALEVDNDKLKDELMLRERDRLELLKQLDEFRISKVKIHPTNSLKSYDKYTPAYTNDVYKSKSSNHIDNLKERLSHEDHSTFLNKFENKDKVENVPVSSYKYNTVEIIDRSLLSDGSSLITYSNGTTKTTRPNGHNTTKYFNGDTKDSYPDGKTTYYYANSKTKHYTFPDGSEIYYFNNGQSEKHYPVGTREVTFPDGTIKFIDPNNHSEETIFPDGSVLKTYSNGKTEMEFANGEKEVHNETYRRRDYPDGTSKTIFNDGTQQTTYPSGRVRIKDALGCVIFDGIK